jgi:hypothetical protein
MKPLAYSRYKYSGEFYKFVRTTVGSTSSLSYYFVGNIALTAGLAKTGQLTIRADQPIAIGSLIANIKDSNGNLILDDAIWQISGLEPILNAFNTIEGYRMKAVKYQGTL